MFQLFVLCFIFGTFSSEASPNLFPHKTISPYQGQVSFVYNKLEMKDPNFKLKNPYFFKAINQKVQLKSVSVLQTSKKYEQKIEKKESKKLNLQNRQFLEFTEFVAH